MRSGISAGPPVDSLSLPNQPADNFIVGCRDCSVCTAPNPALRRRLRV
jgi:hypothetical protein